MTDHLILVTSEDCGFCARARGVLAELGVEARVVVSRARGRRSCEATCTSTPSPIVAHSADRCLTILDPAPYPCPRGVLAHEIRDSWPAEAAASPLSAPMSVEPPHNGNPTPRAAPTEKQGGSELRTGRAPFAGGRRCLQRVGERRRERRDRDARIGRGERIRAVRNGLNLARGRRADENSHGGRSSSGRAAARARAPWPMWESWRADRSPREPRGRPFRDDRSGISRRSSARRPRRACTQVGGGVRRFGRLRGDSNGPLNEALGDRGFVSKATASLSRRWLAGCAVGEQGR